MENNQKENQNKTAETDERQEKFEKAVKKTERSEKSVKSYQHLILRILLLILVVWVLFFKIIGLTHMPSGDMHPRIDAGDMVLFYRLDKEVHAKDVIVFEKVTPDSDGKEELFISRVVAQPGDTVEIRDAKLIVNGNAVIESDIFYATQAYEEFTQYPITLQQSEWFVLGDCRESAADSRYFGPVQESEIQGNVISILRRNNL